jgi:hypothetical protein
LNQAGVIIFLALAVGTNTRAEETGENSFPSETDSPAMAASPSEDGQAVLRKDPTQMSPRFREVLRQLTHQETSGDNAAASPASITRSSTLPKIRLLGKIEAAHRKPGVVLDINGESGFLDLGHTLTLAGDKSMTTIRAVAIDASEVRLEVSTDSEPPTLLILR